MPVNFTDKSLWNPANPAINNVNVPTLGEINTVIQALTGGASSVNYGSQNDLGKRIVFTDAEIVNYTYATNGKVYGGIFQAVFIDPAATAANVAAGKIAFLKDAYSVTPAVPDSGAKIYDVTDQSHADSTSMPAGVFLMSATPGNYTVIQVHGKANVLFTTIGTAGVGAGVFVGATGDGTVDSGSAAVTMATIGTYLGNAIIAPVTLTISPIQMKALLGRY